MTYSLGGALGTMQRISSVTTLLVLTLAVSASASEGQFDRRAQPSVFKHPVLDRWACCYCFRYCHKIYDFWR